MNFHTLLDHFKFKHEPVEHRSIFLGMVANINPFFSGVFMNRTSIDNNGTGTGEKKREQKWHHEIN